MKSSTSPLKKNDTIDVLNKDGTFVSSVSLQKALFSVKRDKSIWIDSDTIQILYHSKDEKRFKKETLHRDNYTCYYCGDVMYEGHSDVTVDHVIPQRSGGSVLPKNMVCSCISCNAQKGYRTYNQYFMSLYAGLLYMVLWLRRKE